MATRTEELAIKGPGDVPPDPLFEVDLGILD
jgi:hypothetical protein